MKHHSIILHKLYMIIKKYLLHQQHFMKLKDEIFTKSSFSYVPYIVTSCSFSSRNFATCRIIRFKQILRVNFRRNLITSGTFLAREIVPREISPSSRILAHDRPKIPDLLLFFFFFLVESRSIVSGVRPVRI